MLPKPPEELIRKATARTFVAGLAATLRKLATSDGQVIALVGHQEPLMAVGSYQVARAKFLDYARAQLRGDASVELVDRRGIAIPLSCEIASDTMLFRIGESGYRLDSAILLSHSSELRLAHFRSLMRTNTLPGPAQEAWEQLLAQGALSDEQFALLESALALSVESVLKGTRSSIDRSSALDSSVCVPETSQPIIALLGNPDTGSNLSTHAKTTAGPAWKRLLERDLSSGICLIGPSSVLPFEFLEDRWRLTDADALLPALESVLDSCCDPFTLALVVDICGCRLDDDERFEAIGQRAIDLLFRDGSALRHFAVTLPMTLDGFADSRLLTDQVLFFRRWAAWTWAGQLSRVLSSFQFEHEEVLQSIGSSAGLRASILGSLDRRQAPTWRPDWITPAHIRAVLLRRVKQGLTRIRQRGVKVPEEWELVLANGAGHEPVSSLLEQFPGPFDELAEPGYRLPIESPISLAQVEGERSNISREEIFLADLQPSIFISETSPELLTEIRAAAETLNAGGFEGRDIDKASHALITISHLAGLHRDSGLAGLAAGMARSLTAATKGQTAVLECHVLLDAACGKVDERQYFDFLQTGMERLGQGPITRDHASACLAILDMARETAPFLKSYFGRARAGLRLAARHASIS